MLLEQKLGFDMNRVKLIRQEIHFKMLHHEKLDCYENEVGISDG